MFIEAAGRGVRWHEPRDLSMEEAIDLLSGNVDETHEWVDTGFYLSTRYRGDGLVPRLVAWADGHVSPIGILDRETARALLTRDGGETIPADFDERFADRSAEVIGYIIHWPRVISTTLFVLLTILPVLRNKKNDPDSDDTQDTEESDAEEPGDREPGAT